MAQVVTIAAEDEYTCGAAVTITGTFSWGGVETPVTQIHGKTQTWNESTETWSEPAEWNEVGSAFSAPPARSGTWSRSFMAPSTPHHYRFKVWTAAAGEAQLAVVTHEFKTVEPE